MQPDQLQSLRGSQKFRQLDQSPPFVTLYYEKVRFTNCVQNRSK